MPDAISTRSTRRHRWPAGVLATVLVAGLAGACSDDADPDTSSDDPPATSSSTSTAASPAPSPTPSAEPGPPSVEPIEVSPEVRRQARGGVRDLVDATARALSQPDDVDADDLPLERDGSAREQILNLAAEYAENGWSVRGRARVVDVDVVERTRDPDTIVVAACLDSSDVEVVDANGDPAGLGGNQTPRSLNLITLVPRGDTWVVRDQTFADNPDC